MTSPGWIVRVTTRAIGGGALSEKFFLVAIPDKAVAEGVVREKTQATADQSVEAVSELTTLIEHDLRPDEVKQVARWGIPSAACIEGDRVRNIEYV